MNSPKQLRFSILPGIIMFFFFLSLLRAGHLMIISGSHFREVADESRFFSLPIAANRGIILDRFGKVLLQNTPALFIASTSAQRLFGNEWSLRSVSLEELPGLLAASPSSVILRSKRDATLPQSLAHLIGLTGYSTDRTVETLRPDERVGKTGVERWFDSTLRGRDGTQVVEISALGTIQRTIMTKTPVISGTSLQLSIDRELTDFSFDALKSYTGALVVSDIPTGQILSIVSSPSYTAASYGQALTDPDKPLISRFLTPYPPGSTFKLMTALAALRAGTIKADTRIEDTGEIKIGQRVFGNWYWRQYGRKEGVIDLPRAIARSNDIYFYKTAEGVGPEQIDKVAGEYGYGKRTGIELPGESLGLLPNSAWKEKKVGEKWYLGDTYNMGIGQGYILATPLQVNNMTAAIGRRGVWCPLTLRLMKNPSCTESEHEESALQTVLGGMVQACSTGGTAYPFFPLNEKLEDSKKIACKTGTAEFGGEDSKGRKRTHGWFTMLYPVQKPAVAITVFVESTKDHPFLEGSKDAAPIALKVFEAWKGKYEKER